VPGAWALDAGEGPRRRDDRQNVQQDGYDLDVGGALLRGAPEYPSVAPTPALQALAQDAWAIFYKSRPVLRDPAEVAPEAAASRPLLERLLQEEATARTRVATMLDETAAAIAALAAMPALRRELEQEQKRQQRPGDGTPAPTGGEGEALRLAVRAALRAAGEGVEEFAQVMAGWGIEPAALRLVEPGRRLETLWRLTGAPTFRRMAEMVGRMRNLARRRQRERLRRAPDELHGIETGADLARLLPSELAALGHPLLRLDLWRRLSERQALQYHLRPRGRQGRGPMIVLLDASDSMGNPRQGDLRVIDQAKAVALALVDTARRERRAGALIAFNRRIVLNAAFPAGRPLDLQRLAEVAAVEPSGGTSYDAPLLRGIDMVRRTAELRAADLVLITDGACQAQASTIEALVQARKALGLRVWSILVGAHGYEGSVAPWSDRVWSVGRLTDEVAGDLFEEVATHGDS
jgi:uncharacterized protein with von Willebrand factor type A (vWA) domain